MKRRKISIVIFAAYCAVMLFLLFFRERPQGGLPYWERVLGLLNPVPFETILHFLGLLTHPNPGFVRLAAVNLFGNLIMFVPLGFLLPEVFPKLRSWWRTLLTSAAAILAVELSQMLTLLGTCDVDDLILNVLGAAIGYLIYLLFNKKDADT